MKRLFLILFFILSVCANVDAQKHFIKTATKHTILTQASKHQTAKMGMAIAKKEAKNAVFDAFEHEGQRAIGKRIVEIAKNQGKKNMKAVSKNAFRERITLNQIKDVNKRFLGKNAKLNYLKKSQFKAKNLQKNGIRTNIGINGQKKYYRIGVTPSNQYISSKQYKYISVTKMNNIKIGEPKSGKVLRKNMIAVMSPKLAEYALLGNNQAHHLIGIDPEIKNAYLKLREYGIDVNDPINGIFLPENTEGILKGTIHKGSHSKKYYEKVNELFKTVRSKEECLQKLDILKSALLKGDIPLYSTGKNVINL